MILGGMQETKYKKQKILKDKQLSLKKNKLQGKNEREPIDYKRLRDISTMQQMDFFGILI